MIREMSPVVGRVRGCGGQCSRPEPHELERVLPTGDISLIINLYEDRTRVYDRNDPTKCKTLNGALVVGAYSEFSVIDTAEQRSTMGASQAGRRISLLKPAGRELQDTDVSLDTLWGVKASHLRESLLEAKTPEAKLLR